MYTIVKWSETGWQIAVLFFVSGKRSCYFDGGLCSGFLERKAVVFSIPESRLPCGDGLSEGQTKRKDYGLFIIR